MKGVGSEVRDPCVYVYFMNYSILYVQYTHTYIYIYNIVYIYIPVHNVYVHTYRLSLAAARETALNERPHKALET